MYYPDLLYSCYYSESRDLCKQFYKANPLKFQKSVDCFLDDKFRQDLCIYIGQDFIKIDQQELSHVLNQFVENCTVSTVSDIYYFKEKNIPSSILSLYNISLVTFKDLLKIHNLESPVLPYFLNFLSYMLKPLSNDFKLLVIPSYDMNNNCTGIVFRNLNWKDNQRQGFRNQYKFFITHPSTYIFNYANYEQYTDLYLVEGVFDAMALYSAGIPNVISVSSNRLSSYHFELFKNKKLSIIFDNDLGGFSGLKYIYEYNPYDNVKEFALCPTQKIDLDQMNIKEIQKFIKNLRNYRIITP